LLWSAEAGVGHDYRRQMLVVQVRQLLRHHRVQRLIHEHIQLLRIIEHKIIITWNKTVVNNNKETHNNVIKCNSIE